MSEIIDRIEGMPASFYENSHHINKEAEKWMFDAANIIEEQEAEITRLRAIVDKLPKTADGVPVVPGEDMVWVYGRQMMMDVETQDNREAEHRFVLVSQVCGCWSSREAAENAKEQGNV